MDWQGGECQSCSGRRVEDPCHTCCFSVVAVKSEADWDLAVPTAFSVVLCAVFILVHFSFTSHSLFIMLTLLTWTICCSWSNCCFYYCCCGCGCFCYFCSFSLSRTFCYMDEKGSPLPHHLLPSMTIRALPVFSVSSNASGIIYLKWHTRFLPRHAFDNCRMAFTCPAVDSTPFHNDKDVVYGRAMCWCPKSSCISLGMSILWQIRYSDRSLLEEKVTRSSSEMSMGTPFSAVSVFQMPIYSICILTILVLRMLPANLLADSSLSSRMSHKVCPSQPVLWLQCSGFSKPPVNSDQLSGLDISG